MEVEGRTETRERSTSPTDQVLLSCSGLDVYYGRKQVLHGVDLMVRENEVLAVLGHNGAGKTTLLKTLYGAVRPRSGRIELAGSVITGEPIRHRLASGIAYVEPRGILPGLLVRENLEIAEGIARRSSRRTRTRAEVLDIFPALTPRLGSRAGVLSGGQRQMLALAMAVVTEPRVLLLDEPLLGLAPGIAGTFMQVIATICGSGSMAAILVEQNVRAALEIASRAYVLRAGAVVNERLSRELLEAEDFWSLL